MSNTYTWSIPAKGLMTLPTAEGQSDVVTAIRYTVTGTDGTHTATVNGIAQVKYTAGEAFTPLASLTEAQVIGWVKASRPNIEAQTQAQIDAQIARQATPPVTPTATALPWSA